MLVNSLVDLGDCDSTPDYFVHGTMLTFS